ncbi:MAG: translation initiation factor IF-3 [Oscillospiraceae bacterium]|nr:translation initiation factor IF-3 [Oscillospiraceae bacterium]
MSGRVNKVESPYNKGKFRFILSAYLQIRAFVFAKIIWRCFIISTKKELEINEEIRDKEIRVIGADGSQLGVMSADKALKLAEEADMDLVKIAPTAVPPVCKIMDYGKYRFEQQKKEKENKKNQKVVETKEVRLSINIDTNDFNTKVNQANKFLKNGDKVKVSIRFRGREMAHSKLGLDVMERFGQAIEGGTIEKAAKLEGRNMLMFIAPAHNK